MFMFLNLRPVAGAVTIEQTTTHATEEASTTTLIREPNNGHQCCGYNSFHR